MLKSVLTNNLLLKLLSVALATLLWVHVATDRSYEVQATLPVKEVITADRVALAEPPPDSITTTISATGKDLLRQDWRRAGLLLRMEQNRIGSYEVDLNTSNVALVDPDGIALQGIVSPRVTRLNCDLRDEVVLPVRSRVTVHPAEGFAVSGADTVTPGHVKVSGPRAALNNLEYISTEPRTLTDVRSDFDLQVGLMAEGVFGVTVTPAEATYRVSVTAIKRRTLKEIPIAALNAPDGKVTILPSTVTVAFSGPATDINALSVEAISATVDLRSVDSAGRALVSVSAPMSLSIDSVSDSMVTVRIDSL